MDMTIDHPAVADPAVAGNKAAVLAQLVRAGFNVPPFFVLPSSGGSTIEDPAHRAAISASSLALAGADGALAVRSSSVEEDGDRSSFAGQFATFLDVSPAEVVDKACEVMNSGSSEHIAAYRRSTGAEAPGQRPSVLVQKMIRADKAGVAFAADPVTGDATCTAVAAVCGTGDALVGGDVQGDTWKLDAGNSIVMRDTMGETPVLTDGEVVEIAGLVRAISEHRGHPQDIEWAIRGDELFLLQSRDITTIEASRAIEPVALWDNSNIVESYGGITLPLTFSVARAAYEEAYRHLGRVLGIREPVIRDNRQSYEQMIGLIRGRVYYNLVNWYRLLMLTPGFRYNKGFMEQMMGVTQALPDAVLPSNQSSGCLSRVKANCDNARIGVRLLLRLATHRRRVHDFHRTLDDCLEATAFDDLTLVQLLEAFESLQGRVIPAWQTPLVNDLFCMIFHGALKKLCDAWLDDECEGIHNDLVAGEAAIISLEPVRRMRRMAALARDDKVLVDLLRKAPAAVAEIQIEENPSLKREYDQYLAQFGDRCLDELKLESETLQDDPTPLLRSIGELARMPRHDAGNDDLRERSEIRVANALAGAPVRRRVFNWVLNHARAFVRDRENLRFERTRVYGRVRAIFLEIGRRLKGGDAIERATDIFYLSAEEIASFVRGTGVSGDLAGLVACRRAAFSRYRTSPDLPRRFMTKGPPQAPHAIERLPDEATESGDTRNGQACSRGVVRGQVRVVRDPRKTAFRRGEILVAERTDPGWVTIFPLVAGMIMERGSLLSHSAIVARELNIPAVVGVENACRWLQDGDWVELDGANGVIRRLTGDDVVE